jgi:hypothetical protein
MKEKIELKRRGRRRDKQPLNVLKEKYTGI